ncbi:hypothetical protein [Nocardioides pakistanensis]
MTGVLTDSVGPYDITESRVERLAHLVTLESGWLDGEGAPVTPEAAAVATAVLSYLPPAAQDQILLAPTEEGGITLEHVAVPKALIADVFPDGHIEAALLDADHPEAETEFTWTEPHEVAECLIDHFGEAA